MRLQEWEGPWIAKFLDGPQRKQDRDWAVGPVWREIRVAPSPRGSWFVAGGDGIPELERQDGSEREPWPGEVAYRLRSTRLSKVEGVPTVIAYYYARKK